MIAHEPAIASAAADWLEAMGLEVYEEVHLGPGGRCHCGSPLGWFWLVRRALNDLAQA